jgi:hypothetical protein
MASTPPCPSSVPSPPSALIKHWVQANADENLPASLATLEQAIRNQG